MNEETIRRWRIWLDELQKIASFHSVLDFELQEFPDPVTFARYTAALVTSGYRFQ